MRIHALKFSCINHSTLNCWRIDYHFVIFLNAKFLLNCMVKKMIVVLHKRAICILYVCWDSHSYSTSFFHSHKSNSHPLIFLIIFELSKNPSPVPNPEKYWNFSGFLGKYQVLIPYHPVQNPKTKYQYHSAQFKFPVPYHPVQEPNTQILLPYRTDKIFNTKYQYRTNRRKVIISNPNPMPTGKNTVVLNPLKF